MMRKKIVMLVAAMLLLVPAAAFASPYEATVKWGVNFRSAPSTNASVYRMIHKGEHVQILDKVNAYWYKAQTSDGQVGYISASSKYTAPSGSASSGSAGGSAGSSASGSLADRIIATAESLIGKVDYKFGVRDPAHMIFDCSSFTEYVFEKNGVPMKWGTRYQKDMGTAVSKSNLKKGDLVFFGTNSKSTINHVGIYIGNGQFIHNSPSLDVAISSLSTGYWSNHFITARRVL